MFQSLCGYRRFESSKFQKLQMMQGIFTGFDGVSKIEPQYVYVKPSWVDWGVDYFTFIEGLG